MSDARNDFDNFETALKNQNEQNKLNDYSDFNEEESEEFVPPSNMQFSATDNTDYDYGNTAPKSNVSNLDAIEEQISDVNSDNKFVENERPKMPLGEDDFEIFDNGPLKSEIDSWKKKFGDVWIVDDLPTEQTFVYRDLNRYEYKTIIAMQNTDALMREEIICEQCVLFPYEYSYGEMSNDKAGIPTLLASHIMETSGFTKASMPRRL